MQCGVEISLYRHLRDEEDRERAFEVLEAMAGHVMEDADWWGDLLGCGISGSTKLGEMIAEYCRDPSSCSPAHILDQLIEAQIPEARVLAKQRMED